MHNEISFSFIYSVYVCVCACVLYIVYTHEYVNTCYSVCAHRGQWISGVSTIILYFLLIRPLTEHGTTVVASKL